MGRDETNLLNNAYFNSGWKYAQTGSFANRYYQDGYNGGHQWFTAPSGTAGNAISFTQAMTLGSNSGLSIGTPSAAPAQGLLVQGNVGIGATPTTKLEVTSSDLNNIFVTNPDTSGATTGSGIGFKAFNGTAVAQAAGIILTSNTWSFGTYSPNQLSIGSDGSGGLALRSANAAPITFFTGGTTAGLSTLRLTIASTGAATFSSSVTATQFVANGNSAGGFEGLRIINASTGAAQIVLNNSAQSWLVNTRTDNHFSVFNATSSTTPFLITTGSNVLIGTTTDNSNKLRVNGTGWFDGALTTNGTLNVAAGTTDQFAIGVTSNSTFAFGGLNGRRAAIIAHNSIGDAGLQFGWDTTDKTGVIAGSANVTGAGIDFYTYNGSAWGNRMRVTKDGNVLIGTTTDDNLFKLQVNGGARFTNTTRIENGSFSIVDNNLPQQYFRADLIPTNERTIGTLNYGARFNSTTYGTGASIDAKAVGTWSSTNYGTNLIFSTATENTDVNTARLIIAASGTVRITNLAGSGSRMVVSDANGVLSTQAISAGTVTNVTASSPLFSSGGATPNITIQQASGSQNGFLSSTDWTTFNNKVSGSATAGQVAYWSSASAITGESNLFWDATNDRLGIGTATPAATLEINGNIRTGAPTGTSTENWRLGRALLATSSDPEDRWIRVQLGTKIYDILAIDRGDA
jgi:hypothetical protein